MKRFPDSEHISGNEHKSHRRSMFIVYSFQSVVERQRFRRANDDYVKGAEANRRCSPGVFGLA